MEWNFSISVPAKSELENNFTNIKYETFIYVQTLTYLLLIRIDCWVASYESLKPGGGNFFDLK